MNLRFLLRAGACAAALALVFGGGSPGAALPGSPLDPSDIDHSCKACDDFYQFAVGGWLKKNPIMPEFGISSPWIGRFEANEALLHAAVEKAAADPAASGETKQVGNVLPRLHGRSARESARRAAARRGDAPDRRRNRSACVPDRARDRQPRDRRHSDLGPAALAADGVLADRRSGRFFASDRRTAAKRYDAALARLLHGRAVRTAAQGAHDVRRDAVHAARRIARQGGGGRRDGARRSRRRWRRSA